MILSNCFLSAMAHVSPTQNGNIRDQWPVCDFQFGWPQYLSHAGVRTGSQPRLRGDPLDSFTHFKLH